MRTGNTTASASADRLEALLAQAGAGRSSWTTTVVWGVVVLTLAWAWQGAEMRPLDLIRDADKEVLSKIYNYSGFQESTNDQLTPIRQLELYKDRVKIENDANYNAEEKTRLLADIDKKLAALAK